jgi:hypothetical protein
MKVLERLQVDYITDYISFCTVGKIYNSSTRKYHLSEKCKGLIA